MIFGQDLINTYNYDNYINRSGIPDYYSSHQYFDLPDVSNLQYTGETMIYFGLLAYVDLPNDPESAGVETLNQLV